MFLSARRTLQQKITNMPRLEIQMRKVENQDDGVNWEGMGLQPPKGKEVWKRRLIDTIDIEFVDEYTKELSLLKCVYMESPCVIKGNYDEICIKINDLENAELEGEGE